MKSTSVFAVGVSITLLANGMLASPTPSKRPVVAPAPTQVVRQLLPKPPPPYCIVELQPPPGAKSWTYPRCMDPSLISPPQIIHAGDLGYDPTTFIIWTSRVGRRTILTAWQFQPQLDYIPYGTYLTVADAQPDFLKLTGYPATAP